MLEVILNLSMKQLPTLMQNTEKDPCNIDISEVPFN